MFNAKMKQTDYCKQIRDGLADSAGFSTSTPNGWLAGHVARCARCQGRLQGFNRVSLGLSLLKNQRHSVDLLARANKKTLRYLKNNVRETASAIDLSQAMPEPGLVGKFHRYGNAVSNAAACLFMALLLKTGIYHSITQTQRDGDETIKGLYAKNLDANSQTFKDIFNC